MAYNIVKDIYMKLRGIFISLAIIMLLLVFVCSRPGSRGQTIETSHKKKISKETQDAPILEEVKELSGLGSTGVWEAPVLISGDEAGIPFVGESLKGKNIWCVNVKEAALEMGSKNGERIKCYTSNITILFDHESGIIIKINAILDKERSLQRSSKGSIASAERQMREVSEIYTGVPEEKPLVGFGDVLRNIYVSGFGGNPVEASEIEAVYVMQSHLRKEPRAVWAITLHGIPPFSTFGGNDNSVPISQRNHLRTIVDAKTGEVLRSTTVPQP